MLHGNLYKMRDGLYMATLYNQLPHDGIRLDGHYTILFTVPDYKIYCYKHGDYANLVSYIPQGFAGFIELNAKELEYLQDMAKTTMDRKPHLYGTHKYVSEAHFEYDYEIHGIPSYLTSIPL